MATDNFEFKLIDEFPGYNSASDKTKVRPGTLIRGSKNVYKKLSGTIASRCGLKRRGAADSTDAGVKASFEWETNVGTTRPIRVTSDGKLQVESDIVEEGTYVWYDLLETSTLAHPAAELTRFVFDTWWENDEQTDRLIAVRGDDKVLHWSGAMAIVESVLPNQITKTGDETWAEIGIATQRTAEKMIIIGGVEYTYTGGEGTDTLTGVTPDPVGAVNAGDVVIQSVMVDPASDVTGFDFDFCKTVNNQVFYGSYSSRVIYISADITAGGTLGFLNLVDGNSHVRGDPASLTLDSQARGIGVKDGKIIIFGGYSDMYVVTPNSDLNVSYEIGGQDQFVFNKIEKKNINGLSAALGHEFIDNFGDYLVWLDRKNQLRALGTFSTVDSIVPTTLSLAVQSELTEDDFTGGHIKVISNTIHITAPNTGRDWMYEIREVVDDNGQIVSERLWQPPQVRGISRFAILDGIVHGHSNVNPQVYQVEDTSQWFDDNPLDEPIPYTCVMRLAYQQHRRRQGMLTFDKIYLEGYMPQAVNLLGHVYIDYQGSTDRLNIIVNSTVPEDDTVATFFTGVQAPSMGDSSFGDNPLGDGIIEEANDQEQVPKFRAIPGVDVGDHFEYSIEIYSEEADSRWEILCFGTNVDESAFQATELQT
jgi:hypothetical protein